MNFDLVQMVLKIAITVLVVLTIAVLVIGLIAMNSLRGKLKEARSRKKAPLLKRAVHIQGIGTVFMTELSTANKVDKPLFAGRVVGLETDPGLSTISRDPSSAMSEHKQLMSPSVEELVHG